MCVWGGGGGGGGETTFAKIDSGQASTLMRRCINVIVFLEKRH